MGMSLAISSVILVALCFSGAAAFVTVDHSWLQESLPIPGDTKVRKNFDYLVSLIHNNPKWVIKILEQVKKEMMLRDQLSAQSGKKCDACLFQIQYNHSSEIFNDEPHGYQEIEGKSRKESADSTNVTHAFLLNHILRRTRRSHFGKRKSRTSGQKRTWSIGRHRKRVQEKLSSRLPSVPTDTPAHSASIVRGTPEARKVVKSRFTKFATKDSLGRAILSCDEKSRRSYCQHNGRCVVVKILEWKSCICPTGFRGVRCENYDVIQSIETIDRHSDIRSFEDIEDDEERGKMISSIAATAYYTMNTFFSRKSRGAL